MLAFPCGPRTQGSTAPPGPGRRGSSSSAGSSGGFPAPLGARPVHPAPLPGRTPRAELGRTGTAAEAGETPLSPTRAPPGPGRRGSHGGRGSAHAACVRAAEGRPVRAPLSIVCGQVVFHLPRPGPGPAPGGPGPPPAPRVAAALSAAPRGRAGAFPCLPAQPPAPPISAPPKHRPVLRPPGGNVDPWITDNLCIRGSAQSTRC